MRCMTLMPNALIVVLAMSCAGAVAASSEQMVTVSQKSRKFDPSEIKLSKDQTLVIVNDDGDLIHHAYIDSDAFNFDSGDQKPGSRTSIRFPSRGDFKVLCGIHPKMKLTVHVQ